MDLLCLFIICLLLLFVLIKTLTMILKRKKASWKNDNDVQFSIGFFHPYCNAGGGGERVLWCSIQSLQKKYKNVQFVVYTGDQEEKEIILNKVRNCFNIELSGKITFIHLKYRNLVEAKNYPYFTLLLQSMASFILGLEAAMKFVPDIYIDTMGYAWTFPIFKYLCSCKVAAYVHYPTVSSDMIQSVTLNSRKTQKHLFSRLKVIYYRIYAVLYSIMGRQADVVMVNSTWTKNHILEIWKTHDRTFCVYPPCDTSQFESLPLKLGINKKQIRLVSLAQFRPEKDHELQIKALHELLNRKPHLRKTITLILIGGCRHEEDYKRVGNLKALCNELNVIDCVRFKINVSFQEILTEMKNADIALHTMWNEHFGIGIVECMSAGLIMIAHDSGGPKLDIIQNKKTGFLASSTLSYADALESVLLMQDDEIFDMRKSAREYVKKFSNAEFEKSFLSATQCCFKHL